MSPWNGSIIQHHRFIVYGLDVPSLNLSGNFTAPGAEKAMKGHVLAEGEVRSTGTLTPKLIKVGEKSRVSARRRRRNGLRRACPSTSR